MINLIVGLGIVAGIFLFLSVGMPTLMGFAEHRADKKAGKKMKAANQAKEPRKPKKKKEKPIEYIGDPFDTLKEFYDKECSKIEKGVVKLLDDVRKAAKDYKLDDLLFLMTDVKQLRCAHRQMPDLINFLIESNLFYMGEDLNGPLITYGADPEFILCDTVCHMILNMVGVPCPVLLLVVIMVYWN